MVPTVGVRQRLELVVVASFLVAASLADPLVARVCGVRLVLDGVWHIVDLLLPGVSSRTSLVSLTRAFIMSKHECLSPRVFHVFFKFMKFLFNIEILILFL